MYGHQGAYAAPRPQSIERSASQKRRDQANARQAYNNEWKVGMFNAPCADPAFCCYAMFCAQCAAYSQRKLQMGPAWPAQYTCCNGGSCVSGRCGERSNPEMCLCCEVFCCFPSAMVTTRFMIQDEQRVMNSQCDNCLIGFMLITQQIAMCLRCVAMITQNPDIEQLADLVDCLADAVYCSVCACMLTQQNVQILQRDVGAIQRRQQHAQVMAAPVAPQMIYGQPEPRYVPQQPVGPTYVYTATPPKQSKPSASAQPASYYPNV